MGAELSDESAFCALHEQLSSDSNVALVAVPNSKSPRLLMYTRDPKPLRNCMNDVIQCCYPVSHDMDISECAGSGEEFSIRDICR